MERQIYPCLWFDNQAKEAAEFYCGIFPDSKITYESHLVVQFEINQKHFMGLNGGPQFKHSEAVSFVIECKDQPEIDFYWDKLTADGGQEGMCGLCKDKFGISWQVVPAALNKLMKDPNKAQRVTEVFGTMKKLDLQTLLDV